MKIRLVAITFITIISLVSGAVSPQVVVAAPVRAYIEPALLSLTGGSTSVIVTGSHLDVVVRAVSLLGGKITSYLWLINGVVVTLPLKTLPVLAALPGIHAIVANKTISSSYAADAQPTADPKIWQLAYPVGVDIGADELHTTFLSDQTPIRGKGVTVAVVDSGVYFDKNVKSVLGPQVEKVFRGQIDFVESVCGTRMYRTKTRPIGTQYPGYCVQPSDASKDGYGHGTFVAGILWNHFTDQATGATLGIAPDANVLSVRVLDNNGNGTYETVIKGLQYVVENKATYNIRVLNLSLSGQVTTPYFVDPLNRAVERAWANGIVVLAAAGNAGPAAETITVPGNDPYVITVGAINGNRTPLNWEDDTLPDWSSTGPTPDSFVKPDVLAPGSNIISFMYKDTDLSDGVDSSQKLVQLHPDNSMSTSLYRMNGTSMSTAVASGVVALMLQAHPELTPDQVKFRLMYSSRPALTDSGDLVFNIFQQGMGRLWSPEAVLGTFPADGYANYGMDIQADLAHGWETDEDLAYHYQGLTQKVLSDDGQTYLYYQTDEGGAATGQGAAWQEDGAWVDYETMNTWAEGQMTWSGGKLIWSGTWNVWAGGKLIWSGGKLIWSGANPIWSTGKLIWSGGKLIWAGGKLIWSGGKLIWSGGIR